MQRPTTQSHPSHAQPAGRRQPQQPGRSQQRTSQDATSGSLRNAQAKPAPTTHPSWEELLGKR